MNTQVTNLKDIGKAQPDLLPNDIISSWRSSIFNAALDMVCHPDIPNVIKASGALARSHGIPLPSKARSSILGDGIMRFSVATMDGDITFSIWMFIGEIRVAAYVPKATTARGTGVSDAISDSFDGRPCYSVIERGDNIAFEWLFRDKWFAQLQLMIDSVENKTKAAMIADGIGNVVSRIYMSIMNSVIDICDLVVTPENTLIQRKSAVSVTLEVSGAASSTDYQDVLDALMSSGVHVDEYWPQGDGRTFYMLALSETGIEVVERVLNGLCPGRFSIRDINEHVMIGGE